MDKQRTVLVDKQYFLPFVLLTSLFFLWGFAHAILDVLNKHFQEMLDISKTHSALIQAMMYMGYFVMAIPAGLFINRFGYRSGVVFGLLLYGIGSLLFIPGQYFVSFNAFLFALFVIGCGLTFLETAANPYVTELGAKETAASRLNFAQSFNGLGCICAPLLVGWFLFSETKEHPNSVAFPYACMGILVLFVASIFLRVKLPEIRHEAEVDKEGHRVGLWSHRLFIFGLIALFAYEVAEISINSFFINYVVEQRWMDARYASLVLSFGGTVYVGAFLRKLDYAACQCRTDVVLVCYGYGTDHYGGIVRPWYRFSHRPAVWVCVRGDYVPHYLCSFTERAGHPYQACLFFPDDVACGRCGRSVADGSGGRPYRLHGLGVRSALGGICRGVVLCTENAFTAYHPL